MSLALGTIGFTSHVVEAQNATTDLFENASSILDKITSILTARITNQ
ncbi:MAG: hypothetical protein WBX01_05935 [Nitrososphaeraceae archaeon]